MSVGEGELLRTIGLGTACAYRRARQQGVASLSMWIPSNSLSSSFVNACTGILSTESALVQQVVLDKPSLAFQPGDWDDWQYVRVHGTADKIEEGGKHYQ